MIPNSTCKERANLTIGYDEIKVYSITFQSVNILKIPGLNF